ncbi:hypothetical protein [Tateyamaria sp.]|uniref:hypothetical protein n=1 Tax=Tateyamaria sp. TaxID=1929288 RepID=UPI003B217B5E
MSGNYNRQGYLNDVLAASSSKNSARLVLYAMCWNSKFDRAELTITKPQLAEKTRLSRGSIMNAFGFLKEEGSIKVIGGGNGGGIGGTVAPTYSLLVCYREA